MLSPLPGPVYLSDSCVTPHYGFAKMLWLAGVAVLWLTQTVHAIQNSTSVVVREDGWIVYPCYQLDHRLPEFETSALGLWYVIETIEHRDDPSRRGIYLSDSCPKVNLYKIPPSNVKLVWQENGGDIHYSFRMTDPENEGFWMAWGRQTGSLLNRDHRQYEGCVQVLEAEPSHMVLRFCSFNRSHYSLILVRNISITHDTEATRRKLSSYGLAQVRVTQTCRDAQGSATSTTASLVLLLTSSMLLSSRLN